MDTTPTEPPVTGSPVKQSMSFESPYMPTPYANPTPIASSGPYNYFATRSFHDAVSFYLPIYIGGKSNINSVSIKYVSDQTTWSETAIEDPDMSDDDLISVLYNQTKNTKLGKTIKSDDCTKKIVSKHYNLAREFNARGTPTIILENGFLLAGYHSAEEILNFLKK